MLLTNGFLISATTVLNTACRPSWSVQVTKALEDSMNSRTPGARGVVVHSIGDDNAIHVPDSYAAQLGAQQQSAVQGGDLLQSR
jgi:hypothetical protein